VARDASRRGSSFGVKPEPGLADAKPGVSELGLTQ
jgi:hypothetical protein